jgi:hypothetical protein
LRTWGWVAGGVGAAGVLAGTITGVMVFGKKSTVDQNCTGAVCNPEGLSAADSGKSLAMVSNIGFGIGLAGLATGAVLLLTQPKTTASGWQPVVATDATSGAWGGVRRSW